jgi:hypothetical protein
MPFLGISFPKCAVSFAAIRMFASIAAAQPLPFTQSFSFGMVGVAADQVARLNVVNIAPGPAAQGSCAADLAFLDSQGNVLKSSNSSVDAQKTAFLEFERSTSSADSGRTYVRATLTSTLVVSGAPGAMPVSPGSVCSLLATLEIYDKSSGKTVGLLSDAKMVPLSSPPPGAMSGPARLSPPGRR